jgi:hypothetical protein
MGFALKRKTKGTDMELSRSFAAGKAECSEFLLTTARGFALLTEGVFEKAKLPQKHI